MIAIWKDGKLSTSTTNTNQYTGEKTGGEFKAWKLFGTDPSNFIKGSYGVLTSRCATLYHTSSPARACINKPLTYSIGKGLLFKSTPNVEYLKMEREAGKEWGRKFTELLHYEKKAVGYYEKQGIIAREAKITGDSIVYLLREKNTGVPFDIIPATGDAIDWEHDSDGYTLGIKHDLYNRPSGFWSSTAKKFMPFRNRANDLLAIQFMFAERASQLRGYSSIYSLIGMAKNLDRVYDATIERMVQEAIQLGYFQASSTDVHTQAKGMATNSVKSATGDNDNMSITDITEGYEQKPGGMYVLNNDESMQFNDLKTPGNNFGLANEWIIRHFAMATGIPPEVILSEYSSSFTAHKGALNDFVKIFMKERETFIRLVDDKINLEYLKHFARTGQIQVIDTFWSDRKVQLAYLEGVHLGPVPGHINPLQEVQADILADTNGYTLKSSIASKYGNDFWNIIDIWEEEQTKWFEASPEKKAEAISRSLEQERLDKESSDVDNKSTEDTNTQEENK